ncbi:MAG: nucleotidyltransferase family protein [PVC group bacterium]|nr:nucleotidyltransferase family protein [PVC group bacterium]
MQILVLAAGYATRLYPLTKHWPKPLLLVKEKPIISHIIDNAQKLQDITEIIVVTNDKFVEYFQKWAETYNCSAKITVLSDKTTSEDNRLGAIGDIAYVLRNHSITEDLLVIGGDNLFSFDLTAFVDFAQNKKDACTVGLYNIFDLEKVRYYGIVTVNDTGKVVDFEEKPQKSLSTLISMCLYYFPYKRLELIPEYLKNNSSHDAPGNYIRWLHNIIDVWGYELKGDWYDIGDIDTFYHSNVTFKD